MMPQRVALSAERGGKNRWLMAKGEFLLPLRGAFIWHGVAQFPELRALGETVQV